MASLYRPTIIRYVDAAGKQVSKATPGARRIRKKSQTWWGRFRGGEGKVRRVSLSDDRETAETLLADRVKRARREEAGDTDPFEQHRNRPLTKHLDDFLTHLNAKGDTHGHGKQTISRVSAILAGCGFEKIGDISAAHVSAFLADMRKPKRIKVKVKTKGKKAPTETEKVTKGTGLATTNGYLVAIKSFCIWLVKDRRTAENRLAHLSRLNAKTDVRRERRALSLTELQAVIQAAERSKKTFRGLTGPDRALLYQTATYTGLRASELESLSRSSFKLDGNPPTVTVEAGYSKHRRRDVLPLHVELAERLRERLAKRPEQPDGESFVLSLPSASADRTERLWPGTWPEKAAKMLRIDLKAAGIEYHTVDGYCDFHALRHSYITNLVRSGASPKEAQGLARHSTITLTMDRYSHVGLMDLNSALDALPSLPLPQQAAATGTDDVTPRGGGSSVVPIVVLTPAKSNVSQPLSPVAAKGQVADDGASKKPHSLREIGANCEQVTTLEGVTALGLEPRTYGLKVRCSTN